MLQMRQYLQALGVRQCPRAGKFEFFLHLIVELSALEEWPFSEELISYMQMRKLVM